MPWMGTVLPRQHGSRIGLPKLSSTGILRHVPLHMPVFRSFMSGVQVSVAIGEVAPQMRGRPVRVPHRWPKMLTE